MIGAIIGDIVGSRFEWDNHRSKDFDLLTHKCFFTDDSVMSLAVCDALMKCKADYSDLSEQAVRSMQGVGRPYPHCGYGGSFQRWMYSDTPKPYNCRQLRLLFFYDNRYIYFAEMTCYSVASE